ncbi:MULTISPECIES: helix-turn-helix transcriptional regulator [unclassified Acidocella]|uniref:helix-turn-helix transcriptional regulator n=1 Tax=unclassified Acidocella TaxID=2648610 RepID=UPI00028ED157|nr:MULTISPECIES: helix-turn-helix transcriptional regulator [unclassified Acidocella]EKM99382.1 XRE family transcriptional regulator [Acidocella sp. MX-AZ02]WBO58014.1 short-chain fatty acyl-CoA regulator family protein [Acidocella sp. MX-AZ03]
MKAPKIFAGTRLRQARERAGLTQRALAVELGISPSYLNQIEAEQRPLTARLLARAAARLDLPSSYFQDGEDARLAQQLREDLADPLFRAHPGAPAQIEALVRGAPHLAEAFATLYRAYDSQRAALAHAPASLPLFPYDEVRDWVQSRRNHFEALDRAAEALFEGQGFSPLTLREDLRRYLRDAHGISVSAAPGLLAEGMFWRLNRRAKALHLAAEAAPESEMFWLAHVIARLEQERAIEAELRRVRFSAEETYGLARLALVNYFAGALVLPYGRFHDAARTARYDIQRLQRQFGASFEQVCHRLSTLQRPDLPGIPFFFAKTDIAGNVLKRSSATRFQFAQFGGPCPLWNVYRAFSHPGEILVQLARTPDDAIYLNIARTVGRGGGSYLSRPRAVAVVLGCETRHAAQTVYAAGLDLGNAKAAEPIGPGCRACSRTDCRHRSVPPLGAALDTGTAARGVVPYRLKSEVAGG